MRTRWSMAGLALAAMLAAGWAASAGQAPGPQKVTLSIPNTQ